MTALAILEIRSRVAVDLIHVPDKADRLAECEDPLSWTALCGVKGYVYRREPLARLGYKRECFGCRVLIAEADRRAIYSPGPRKYATEEERVEARRRSWRETKRRARHDPLRTDRIRKQSRESKRRAA